MQLEAYLEGLYKYFPAELIQTYVIYKVELFENEYECVFSKYPNCKVVREVDFHSDLLRVLGAIDTKYVLFGVDDVVYFDGVEPAIIDRTFQEHSEEVMGFSLRFGREADFIKHGNDKVTEVSVDGQMVYKLSWKNGQSPHTRYPFELCATIYPTSLVKRIVNNTANDSPLAKKLLSPNSALIQGLGKIMSARKILKRFGYFFSPNTFESWCCRWCQNNAGQLPGCIYFQKLCASVVDINMVNISNNNKFEQDTEYTVEVLNEKYRQGYRLDTDFLVSKKPLRAHIGQEYFRFKRETQC